jgi:tRNA1(Val) A37 N6-methylase TrmN6
VAVNSVPQNFLWLASKEAEDWLRNRAPGPTDLGNVKLRARRLAFDLAVRAMAYEHLRGGLHLPPLNELDPRRQIVAFRSMARTTGLPFLAPRDDVENELMASPVARVSARASALIRTSSTDLADLIGDLYLQVFPSAIRKRWGEFYTPPEVSSLMAAWAVRSAGDLVLDPAVGSGTFLVQAAARLKSLGASPNRCAAQLVGIDVNPTSCLMALANLVPLTDGIPVRLIEGDFFTVRPPGNLLATMTVEKVDAVICNPPYSRHHEMSRERKEELGRLIEIESATKLSRLTSLYVHFMIRAATFLRRGGRLAFLTPAEFMDVNYGQALRTFLVRNFQIDAFVLFPRESTLFRDALTTSCVTFATKGVPRPDHFVRFVRVLDSPTTDELRGAIEAGGVANTDKVFVQQVPQSGLEHLPKWSPLFFVTEKSQASGYQLGDVASVRRGIATGANAFFTVDEGTVTKWDLEPQFLTRIIPHARSASYYDFTVEDWNRLRASGERVWLVSSRKPLAELKSTNLRRYLEWGESQGFSRRYIPSHREPWYASENTRPPPILFTYMGRRRPRFVVNASGALNLNNLHGVTPSSEVLEDPIRLKALLAVANGQLMDEDPTKYGRTYGGGLTKFEPREVENLPLPDFRKYARNDILKLARKFDKLCAVARTGDKTEIADTIGEIVEMGCRDDEGRLDRYGSSGLGS